MIGRAGHTLKWGWAVISAWQELWIQTCNFSLLANAIDFPYWMEILNLLTIANLLAKSYIGHFRTLYSLSVCSLLVNGKYRGCSELPPPWQGRVRAGHCCRVWGSLVAQAPSPPEVLELSLWVRQCCCFSGGLGISLEQWDARNEGLAFLRNKTIPKL